MAHFAQLNDSNTVLTINVIADADCLDGDGNESEAVGVSFCEGLFGVGTYKQTSYNTYANKHFDADGNEDGGTYRARKFSTKYPLSFEMIKTADGEAIGHDFGAESEVEVLWKAGNAHPQHGVATYLTAVKVHERTEGYKSSDDETNEFFA